MDHSFDHFSGHGGGRQERRSAGSVAGSTHSFGQGGDGGAGAYRAAPSSKVHDVANEVAALEQRGAWLEERNTWLTKKLLETHRKFIEKNLVGNVEALKRRMFSAWSKGMVELRLERQLEVQTASLDQCQRVASELGEALTQEQEARKAAEAALANQRQQNERLVGDKTDLLDQREVHLERIELLEKQLAEAEAHVSRSKRAAHGEIEAHSAYESRKRELQQELREFKKGVQAMPLEQSRRSRDDAHVTIQRVAHLLDRGKVAQGRNPERDRSGSASLSPERDLPRPTAAIPMGRMDRPRSDGIALNDNSQWLPDRRVGSKDMGSVSPARGIGDEEQRGTIPQSMSTSSLGAAGGAPLASSASTPLGSQAMGARGLVGPIIGSNGYLPSAPAGMGGRPGMYQAPMAPGVPNWQPLPGQGQGMAVRGGSYGGGMR